MYPTHNPLPGSHSNFCPNWLSGTLEYWDSLTNTLLKGQTRLKRIISGFYPLIKASIEAFPGVSTNLQYEWIYPAIAAESSHPDNREVGVLR